MTVKLQTLSFNKRGSGGWISGELPLNATITIFEGDNTTGKTPLLKGIVFALGYPAELPSEVKEHCESVTLKIKIGNEDLTFTREISDQFKITVDKNSMHRKVYENSNDFSDVLYKTLDIERTELTLKGNNGSVLPYVDNLFPIFWIDQDLGWGDIYRPIKNKDFIKSQREEMLRIALGLSPKHPFRERDALNQAKIELESTKENIAIKQHLFKELGINSTIVDKKTLKEFCEEREHITFQLNGVLEKMSNLEVGTELVNNEIKYLESKLSETQDKIRLLNNAKFDLNSELTDLDAEISILTDNATIDDTFKEFCGAPNCQVFNRESFGKKLLYLKDQKKDMRLVLKSLDEQLQKIKAIESKEKDRLNEYRSINIPEKNESIAPLVKLSTKLSSRLTDLDTKIAKTQQQETLQAQFNALLNKKNSLENRIKELSPKGGRRSKSEHITKAKQTLQTTIIDWLNCINFEFKSLEITDNFELNLNGRIFREYSEESGSSRQRVVLAYHAAVLESSIILQGQHPQFIIFDGIIQHELDVSHLKKYIEKLVELESKYTTTIQVVMSITTKLKLSDAISIEAHFIRPNFTINNRSWFLGPE